MRDVGVGVGCKWWGKVVKNVFIRPRVLKKAAKKTVINSHCSFVLEF